MRGTARGAARMRASMRMRREKRQTKEKREKVEGFLRLCFEGLAAVGVASSLVGRFERGID